MYYQIRPGEEEIFFRDHGEDRPFSVQVSRGECAA